MSLRDVYDWMTRVIKRYRNACPKGSSKLMKRVRHKRCARCQLHRSTIDWIDAQG